MKSRGKERILALLLAAAMAGNLCAGVEAAAQETESEDKLIEEVTDQNENSTGDLTGPTTKQDNLTVLTEETADSEETEVQAAEELSTDEACAEEEVKAPSEDMRRGAAGEEVSGSWGKTVKWSVNGDILTFSGTGKISDWEYISEIDRVSREITKIIIKEGITGGIENLAFRTFPNLKSVVIPQSVTEMGSEAFCGCRSLESINIPNKVTEISFAMFQDCVSLKNITIPESVTQIDDYAFLGCNALKNVTIPKSVMRIGEHAFSGCSNLTKAVILSKTNSTEIGYGAFMECSSLVDVELPYRGSVSIAAIAFAGCSNLSSIIIPESVMRIGSGAFSTCNNLKNITIKNKSCSIEENKNTINSTATIYGYKDSTAQDYARKYNRKFVELKEPVVKATKITISGPSHKIAAGKKVALKATVSPSNATNKAVTWKSGNTRYATVSSKGIVTMKKAGKGKTVTITATAKDGSGKKAVYKIKFMKGAVKKVAISGKSRRTVQAGKAVTLKASVKATVKSSKDVNKALKWTTSNKKYATVTSKGKVRTLKAGKGKKVKITAAATDGSGKKATVTITLK